MFRSTSLARLWLLLAAIFLVSCSMSEDYKQAEQSVPRFHSSYDAGEFKAIYSTAGNELKKATTEERFVKFMTAVHQKLGEVTSSKATGKNINYNTSGTYVTLNFVTTFSKGKGTEQFVYHVKDGKPLLIGYHINSDALVFEQ
ncbi:DUF4019 domain-containing protein [Chitinilyticum aquatile]|uniref:DUF4019 domain-containing protein n=1 Tax=Chitinilyticum aquatile TaxID=362520 RepID=UPI00041065FC|nr:DUF4019 domain-containing protein [Chitinilyticum aquatile]